MTSHPPAPAVPGFELGRLLGRGGMGEVWEAVRVADGRPVAVKVLAASPEAVDAAAREASVSARVAAEHVLAVEASVELPDGRVALVMPVLRGGSLARLVAARGHLSPGEVVTVLAPLAAALGRLHAAGVVHGDVSPGNVLLDLDGRPVLADLGLARVLGEVPGPVWGTEGHLAPEVLMGADPTPASDVYALGALGWLCLSGAPPGQPGLRPALAEVSRAGAQAGDLVGAVEVAVASRPENRPSADELAWVLFRAADPEPLHLVEGDDEVSAVTYRLRAAAQEPPERTPGPAPQRRGRRRAGIAVVTAAGLVAATALVGWGWAGARETGSAGGAPDARPSAPAARPSAPAARPPATRPPVTPARAVADARADPRAPATRPLALLEVLADARAQAWRTADVRHLLGAHEPGGPMHARDRAAVADLARAGLRYEGLRYLVTDVTTLTAGPRRAVLRARFGTSAYTVSGAGPGSARPGRGGEVVDVEVVRTADGWRIRDLRPRG